MRGIFRAGCVVCAFVWGAFAVVGTGCQPAIPASTQPPAAPAPSPTPTPSPAPVVSSVSPASGSIFGGDTVTITGSHFQTGATAYLGSYGCASITQPDTGTIQCTTSSGFAGTFDVTVQNPDLQRASLPASFAYTGTATLTLLSQKIFTGKCESCHSTSAAATSGGGFDITSYGTGILPRVTPGTASTSTLYERVSANLCPKFSPSLSDEEKNAIADWINAGANNN